MRTREERRRLRMAIIAAWCAALLVLWAAMLLCVCADAAFDGERFSTNLAVTGAAAWTWALMKIILWLDKPRREKR